MVTPKRPPRKATSRDVAAPGPTDKAPDLDELIWEIQAAERRQPAAAWRRVVFVLNQLVGDPALRTTPGVQAYVAALRDISEDIGENVSNDSTFDEAMKKLEAGFRRAHRVKQDAPRAAAKAWVLSEWQTHAAAYDTNKAAFARDYAKRLKHERGIEIKEREIRERWLKPAGK